MRLEMNNSGAWKLVLSGLQYDSAALDEAKTAAATLASVSADQGARRPLAWRLVSEADGAVIEHCSGADGWQQGYRRGRAA